MIVLFNRPLIISEFFHSIRSHLKEHFDAQQLLDLSIGGESVKPRPKA